MDEDEEEPDNPGMSKQAKAMQKLIRNREGNDAYESDEDNRNPYASSVRPSYSVVLIDRFIPFYRKKKRKRKKNYQHSLGLPFNSNPSRLTPKPSHRHQNLEMPTIREPRLPLLHLHWAGTLLLRSVPPVPRHPNQLTRASVRATVQQTAEPLVPLWEAAQLALWQMAKRSSITNGKRMTRQTPLLLV